jgi:Peptidase family M48
MNFALHGLTLALVWFLAVNVTASVLVVWASTRLSEARSSRDWFALRILPGCAAALFVVSVFLPSYWRYEPRETSEGFDLTLAAGAVLAGGLLAAAALRGLNAWRRASARARAWMRNARPLVLRELPPIPGSRLPAHVRCPRPRWWNVVVSGARLDTRIRAFEVEAERPFMALVGVLRPRLLVTRSLMDVLSGEELSACVDHELGHCRAWDNLKRLAMRASPDALFATSAARAIERRWAAASEHAADDMAAHHGMAARCALASALVKVARLIPDDRALTEPISTLVGGGEIAARVRRLLDDRAVMPAAGRPGVPIAAVAALAGIGAVYGPLLRVVHHATELLVHSLP